MEITIRSIKEDEVQVFIYDSVNDEHAVMEIVKVEDMSFENLQKLMNESIPKLIKTIRDGND